MIYTKHLAYAHPDGQRLVFPDMQCAERNALLITGRSGAGKTTLLHLLAGLLKPAAGEVNIAGTDISRLNTAKMDAFRGRHIGIIYQRSHFVASLSVQENLLLPASLAGKDHSKQRLQEIAERLQITGLLHKLPAELSQGEQQRASIARALITSPALLLADEPTASLDDVNCLAVAGLLAEQAKEQGAALLIVTHDSRLKEVFGDRVELE